MLNWARIYSARPGLAVFSGGIERAGNHLRRTVLEAFGKHASVAYRQILGSCIDWLLAEYRCTRSVSCSPMPRRYPSVQGTLLVTGIRCKHYSVVCTPPYVHFGHSLSLILLRLYRTGVFWM